MALMINYDLGKPGQNYEKLKKAIDDNVVDWAKVTESCFLVQTSKTCSQLFAILAKVVDNNDRLFISKLSGEAHWHNALCGDDDRIRKILNTQ
jgi:hypothetical protein